ncbi:MAG: LamG domain-containing protein [Bradymonadaceae bacterium]
MVSGHLGKFIHPFLGVVLFAFATSCNISDPGLVTTGDAGMNGAEDVQDVLPAPDLGREDTSVPVLDVSDTTAQEDAPSEGSDADVLDSGDTSDADVSDTADISDTSDAADTGPEGPERITSGLVVLYTFAEGQGTITQDVSGVSPAHDLTMHGNVEWLAGGGIRLLHDGRFESNEVPTKIYERVSPSGSGQFTVELWMHPADLVQWGPGRLFTLSRGPTLRNLTVAHQDADVHIRVRNDTTDDGLRGRPYVNIPDVVPEELKHYAVVYDGEFLGVYIDGVLVAREERAALSGWDPTMLLSIGREIGLGDDEELRQWTGKLHLVAMYDRPLSAEEVLDNFAAGL